MTTRTEAGAEKSFVGAFLPWIIAGLLAVVYLLTLNHWISFRNLNSVARAAGQTWGPEIYSPLFNLVTAPFHWLPETWVPVVLNLFSVVCAFFVLLLLARCVALLPQDRTQTQRDREHSRFGLLSIPTAWIPPVLAALVLGLQLTFWENATTLSNGMFDLVLFAYAVRSLLEYRLSKSESWLLRAVLVYAAGATDNWVLIGLAPFFLGAIIWIKGFAFFDLRFLTRLFLCALAGLAFFLYLPLLHVHTPGFFWYALRENVSYELYQVRIVYQYMPHYVQFLLILTSLLPILMAGINWKSAAVVGETSRLGSALTIWILHFMHFALLVVCIWAAFDTGFGLRDSAGKYPDLDINRDRLLPLYFIGSLSIGYLSGYLLLIFRPVSRRSHRRSPSDRFLLPVATGFVIFLLVLTPLGLLFKNVPLIHVENGPTLRNYASFLTEKLPQEGVLLGDSAGSLVLAREWLARSGKADNYLFLDTRALKDPAYYVYQTRRNPDRWPRIFTNLNSNVELMVTDPGLMHVLRILAEKHPVYYLNPSFGYYFEEFYAIPHGLVNELKAYPTNSEVSPPPFSDEVFAENEAFWKEHDHEIRAIIPEITPPAPDQPSSFRQQWLAKMRIPFERNIDALQIGSVYSRALNAWGVDAQRMGRTEEAGAHFNEAVQLYPDNVVAHANADFNQKLRKGDHVAIDDLAAFEERFGKFGNWETVLNINGMFDEPTGCLAEGIVFARGHLNRQAAQCLQRSLALAPESLLARLWLARVYLPLGTPDKAFPLIDQLKARSSGWADAAINSDDVFEAELSASYAAKQPAKVQNLLTSALSQNPADTNRLTLASRVCVANQDFTNALSIVDKQLQLAPTSVTRLIDKAYVQMQLSDFNGALVPLSKAVSIQPTNSAAIYCRAVSYFQTGRLDESQKDYETLEKLRPNAFPAYHGLAEIALRKKDTKSAIHFLELDLKAAPPGSEEVQYATAHLKTLKSGSP